MKLAEVIAIGDELTSGQRLDTNSQWISARLGELGIRTLFHTTVADDLSANITAFQQATTRADVVICTGGLGPTADDLTREAIAQAFDRPLALHEPSLTRIREMFTTRGREMPERNRVQAMCPEGGKPIENPHGTAPGIDITAGPRGTRIFALPGVPAEMKEMWEATVAPALGQAGEAPQIVRHYRLKCFGVGESHMEEKLPDLIRRGREPSVGITVSQATITLRITAHGADEAACLTRMQPTIQTIHDCLGTIVFGEEDDELQHVVARLLREEGTRLGVCEWGSGGLISDWLHQLGGAESFFAGSKVVSSPDSAARLLDVNVEEPVHHQVRQLARAIRDRTGADYGLAVGPFPTSVDDPKARIYLGLDDGNDVQVQSRRFAGHPNILKQRAAKQALDLVRLHLLGRSDHD